MAKSKRAKVVSLTKTLKKARPAKTAHIDTIRECVDRYRFIYIIQVANMRNNLMKKVRSDWATSKFFFGKNKIVGVALGRTPDDEYKPNLCKLSSCLKGDCGVMFTDSPLEDVTAYFDAGEVAEFARAGFESTIDFIANQGPLDFPFSMEPTLRQLGLDTKLNKGVVELVHDHKICAIGDVLTPEQCRLLKLFGQMIATFRIDASAMWTDGQFQSLTPYQMDQQQ
uniref:Ribosome assembly factor mrt4 n=1 Tax=Spongospora subterranea TaxID=70186 RepID=A0A0H5RA88_9EUKA|eukprot:CRZ10711.1 hypothetical protein [Spongospora subterranea]